MELDPVILVLSSVNAGSQPPCHLGHSLADLAQERADGKPLHLEGAPPLGLPLCVIKLQQRLDVLDAHAGREARHVRATCMRLVCLQTHEDLPRLVDAEATPISGRLVVPKRSCNMLAQRCRRWPGCRTQ
eukprot:scaffold189765_cov36-Tisochrysis_lutea.AAC.1